MADLVPHPLHSYANSLLTRVRASQTRLTGKQVRPATAIANGTAWVSPAATTWAAGFAKQAAAYVMAVRALDDELVDLLRRTPPTCSVEEAARWRAKLGGGHGA
jgi:hypothetical protein